MNGHMEIVILLLSVSQNNVIDQKDDYGVSAINYATIRGHFHVARCIGTMINDDLDTIQATNTQSLTSRKSTKYDRVQPKKGGNPDS